MRQATNLVTRGADALAFCGVGQRPELLKFLRPARAAWRARDVVGAAGRRPVCRRLRQRARDGAGRALPARSGASPHRRCWPASRSTTTARSARVAGVRSALEKAGLELPPPMVRRAPIRLGRGARRLARVDGRDAGADRHPVRQRRARASARCSKRPKLGIAVPEAAVDRRLRRSRDGAPHAAGADDAARADRRDVANRRRPAAVGIVRAAVRHEHRDERRAGGSRIHRAGARSRGRTLSRTGSRARPGTTARPRRRCALTKARARRRA